MASVVLQLWISFFFFCILFSRIDCKFEVELVQAVFRHGDRTPGKSELFPNDQHLNSSVYKQYGYKQLTNAGKLREFRIGQMLRDRYNDFLGTYHPANVYAFSSNSVRTKMSLQLALAGLYSVSKETLWNGNVNWSPVPNNHVPKELDILNSQHHCSQYLREVEKLKEDPYIKQKMSDFGPLFEDLKINTGFTEVGLEDAYVVFNSIVAYDGMNMTRPEWLTDDVFQKLLDLAAFKYEYMSYTTNLKRMYGGMYIKQLIENMNKTRKIYLYATHDTLMATILKSHRFNFPKLPGYGFTFILENLRDENNNKFIQILTWDAIAEKLTHMKLDDCDYVCPLEDYKRIVKEVLPSDEERRCLINKLGKNDLERILNNDI